MLRLIPATWDGFWKDWSTRLGVGIWAVTLTGHVIHDVLVIAGVVHPRKATTVQDLMDYQKLRSGVFRHSGLYGVCLRCDRSRTNSTAEPTLPLAVKLYLLMHPLRKCTASMK